MKYFILREETPAKHDAMPTYGLLTYPTKKKAEFFINKNTERKYIIIKGDNIQIDTYLKLNN
jgi:hypothetical protein